jgi:hypothetical protein
VAFIKVDDSQINGLGQPLDLGLEPGVLLVQFADPSHHRQF